MTRLCGEPPLKPVRKSQHDDDVFAAQLKALGHPLRLQIIRILLDYEDCICGDLVEALPVAQSTVSEHLRILKQAGLVKGRVDGPRRCYCADRVALARLREELGAILEMK